MACARKIHALRPYKMSVDIYDEWIIKQNNRCKICNKEESMTNQSNYTLPLSVDHCHICNINRALLCHDCNNFIGRANDSVEILQSAITYLKKH